MRDCAEPHDAEVYAIDDLTIDADDYPGMDAVANDTERICAGDAFERYVGSDVASSPLRLLLPVPERGELGAGRPGVRLHGDQHRWLHAHRIRAGQRRLTLLAS